MVGYTLGDFLSRFPAEKAQEASPALIRSSVPEVESKALKANHFKSRRRSDKIAGAAATSSRKS
jgi:hypothetical protein